MNIELHIFTNATPSAPDVSMISKTYNSFLHTFDVDFIPTVWCDPKPNKEDAAQYIKNLEKCFDNINVTKSLSHGYISAVDNSKSDFMFMLEHDWEFVSKLITHRLDEICDLMLQDNLLHFRFNKRQNKVARLDKTLTEVKGKIDYCVTPILSNNPHIINRELYIKNVREYLTIKESGTYGIEQELFDLKKLSGAIYGKLGYPQTVNHLDGRNTPKK